MQHRVKLSLKRASLPMASYGLVNSNAIPAELEMNTTLEALEAQALVSIRADARPFVQADSLEVPVPAVKPNVGL